MRRCRLSATTVVSALLIADVATAQTECAGQTRTIGSQTVTILDGGGVLAQAKLRRGIAVPFIVSDVGPRIGEGSPALARRLAGLTPKADLTRAERFQGQVATNEVTWVFFGGPTLPPPYTAAAVEAAAQAAFESWGGPARLRTCAAK